ncbi:hypothetical protein SM124_07250 [Bacillus sp. 31A1R]|uniref:Uncharacterized protein n=1 Tax=Robertmurraya mangrovi TaxID=3098077 RepID=A0ABU5IWQ0_9BACI|nr:hypothetical protein [Bacillus sp. 31A1R]MDZ5471541.1 hypothetical protein [Bacillus sp. 31A1R]
MNGYLSSFMEKAKMTFQEATAFIKEKLNDLTGTPSATVPQIAEFVINHADTDKTSKSLLGLTYHFYHLKRGDMYYYLEMKDSVILQLDLSINGHSIVSYRSYRDKFNLDQPIVFSENPIE